MKIVSKPAKQLRDRWDFAIAKWAALAFEIIKDLLEVIGKKQVSMAH